MASPCLCKPPLASEPASHVKPVTKQTFGRASLGAAREAAPEALPNGALETLSPQLQGENFVQQPLQSLLLD